MSADPLRHASPSERYAADLAAGTLLPDPAQAAAVGILEGIFASLHAQPPANGNGLVDRLLGRRRALWPPVRGAYLWGPVGRGKTYLVDTFFDALPFAHKRRLHFHSFMREVHAELRKRTFEADPLKQIAAAWATQVRVLALDEFHVGDITDAMLLHGLLDSLVEQGVTLIATSNEAPDELYSGGLQRARFVPAIELLKASLSVFEVAGATDYRLRALEQAPVYYCCAAGEARVELERSFLRLAGAAHAAEPLVIDGREIPTVRHGDGIAWVTFAVLCRGARSAADYVELARCHHTVLLEDVPVLGTEDGDPTRRLINLVDALYDHNVNLIVSAAAEPEGLYRGTRLAKPFLRTASRMREMRSRDYLARQHLA